MVLTVCVVAFAVLVLSSIALVLLIQAAPPMEEETEASNFGDQEDRILNYAQFLHDQLHATSDQMLELQQVSTEYETDEWKNLIWTNPTREECDATHERIMRNLYLSYEGKDQ